MKLLLAFITSSLCLIGCSINEADYKIKGATSNPSLAIPLIEGSIGIVDAFSENDLSYVKTYPDGLVYLNYDQMLSSQDVRNLINLPALSITRSVPVAAGTYPPSPADYTLLSVNFPIDMTTSPEKLTDISFKGGSLSFNISSITPANANFLFELNLTIPEFKNADGLSLTQKVSTGLTTIPLQGYTYTSTTSNRFNLQVVLIVKKSTSLVTISDNSNINIDLSLVGLDFQYIRGFFGDQTTTTSTQTLSIAAFGSSLLIGKASVAFKQPIINLTVVNDYGTPLQVNFIKLLGRKNTDVISITTSPASPIMVNSPTTLGASASTTVSVTNITQVLNFAPTSLEYQVSGRINPGLTTGSNFMADTSKMRVKMHVEIPLYGSGSDIILSDTATIDLTSINQTQIEKATLQTKITNELPMDAFIQLYLVDKNSVVLDSLISSNQNPIVKGSTVDANGDLKTAGIANKSIDLESTKVTKLFQSAKLILVAKLNTSGGNGGSLDVKFKSQYKLTSSIALLTKIRLTTTF
jgi:hypothetical protein